MNVRAKFKCTHVENDPTSDGSKIVLEPVTSGSAENESFFSFTPWGKIELGIVKGDAAKQFEVGGEYYVDFTHAESDNG